MALALNALCCALALQVPTLPLHPNPSPNPNPNLKPNAPLTLTASLTLQFHLSYWSIEGWPHDGAGTEWGTATAIGLGLSSLACVLANAAATRAPLNLLLLAAVTLTLAQL